MPKPVKRRTYTSPLRTQQAAQTRHLIVEAAAGLFMSTGYARTTIKDIASQAGVAPDTVYATFGSKVRVLTAVLDSRLAPGGEASIMDTAEPRAVRDDPDQRRQLQLFARDMAAISARIRPIFEVLRTAAAVEPEVGAVFAEMEQHRLAHMRQVAVWLARRGPLRVSRQRAGEIIWALVSPDVGRMLCDVQGWSQAEHAAWLETTLACSLLPPS
ncbi:MAG: TetR/AcrR family transcriptional regulator [Acidimicrobiia bacterium]|nr:TetR/AcrR family transcriptional regulator [Acidimicrobiia bacterium]